MPSTTVHIPDSLLAKIDKIVKEQSISRNRFIINACEEALKNSAGQWPQDFFGSDLSATNLRLLKEGVAEMEDAIMKMRKNRTDVNL
jgi:metal-responsive CopG/Arc/MetJ family transcriptional regulator